MPTRKTPDPFALKIGARMRALRREKNMSLARLSLLSGLSKGHASNLENGLVMMSLATAGAVARGLSIPLFVLFLLPDEDELSQAVEEARRVALGDIATTADVLRRAGVRTAKPRMRRE